MPTKVRGSIRVSTHAGNVFGVFFAIVTRLRRTSFLFLFLMSLFILLILKNFFFQMGARVLYCCFLDAADLTLDSCAMISRLRACTASLSKVNETVLLNGLISCNSNPTKPVAHPEAERKMVGKKCAGNGGRRGRQGWGGLWGGQTRVRKRVVSHRTSGAGKISFWGGEGFGSQQTQGRHGEGAEVVFRSPP